MKTLTSLILTFLTPVSMWAFSGNGKGTAEDPYLITNANELFEMNGDLSAHYKLVNDIDLKSWLKENSPEQGWAPIGLLSTPFTGSFDGNGRTIKNLWTKRPKVNNVGFIGYAQAALIENIVFENFSLEGQYQVGCIGNCHESTLREIEVRHPMIHGKEVYGGVVGYAQNSNISNCYVMGGQLDGQNTAGGILGYGFQQCAVSSCYSSSNISGHYNIGGICGLMRAETRAKHSITDSYATGRMVSKDSINVGGILGYIVLTASSYYDYTGDFVFEKNYSYGTVKGAGETSNGLLGRFYRAETQFKGSTSIAGNVCLSDTIYGSYRISAQKATGYNYASLNTVVINADGETVEVQDNMLNGTSMSNSLLKKSSTYSVLGWDFEGTWQDVSEYDSYPIHVGQTLPPVVEKLEAKSNCRISGTAPFSNGRVFVSYNDFYAACPVIDGKWNLSLGNLSAGAEVVVWAKEPDKMPSPAYRVFASGDYVEPDAHAGDANGDGKLDVADVVGIVNCILSNPSDQFNLKNADINKDGEILVDDAVGTITLILEAQ